MSKVWLITGSGNGLGRDIAEAVLAAADSVVAGARRTEEGQPLPGTIAKGEATKEEEF
jgi:NAD(P)-dependent dehydrogenase (short-subunit alcohol dehydrogenase family)